MITPMKVVISSNSRLSLFYLDDFSIPAVAAFSADHALPRGMNRPSWSSGDDPDSRRMASHFSMISISGTITPQSSSRMPSTVMRYTLIKIHRPSAC